MISTLFLSAYIEIYVQGRGYGNRHIRSMENMIPIQSKLHIMINGRNIFLFSMELAFD